MPRISLIILNWDGAELIRDCLESVAAQDFTNFETIVVDNGSTDGSADIVAREFPSVHLIRNSENTGFCRGNNIGIGAATGDLIVLLNNDAELAPTFLSRVAYAADLEPEVGMFASAIIWCNSPASNISIMMSLPPTNSPLT